MDHLSRQEYVGCLAMRMLWLMLFVAHLQHYRSILPTKIGHSWLVTFLTVELGRPLVTHRTVFESVTFVPRTATPQLPI